MLVGTINDESPAYVDIVINLVMHFYNYVCSFIHFFYMCKCEKVTNTQTGSKHIRQIPFRLLVIKIKHPQISFSVDFQKNDIFLSKQIC